MRYDELMEKIIREDYSCPQCGFMYPVYHSQERSISHKRWIYCLKCKEEFNFERRRLMMKYEGLPGSLIPGMKRYIEHGIQPGSFLTAVICNNLKVSFERADDFNQELMFDIVKWMYNEAPIDCWGSPSRMRRWIKDHDGVMFESLPEFPE